MTTHAGRIASVNTSPGGVPKLPVAEAWIGQLGSLGYGHNEPEPAHGGPDKAVSLYASSSVMAISPSPAPTART